MDDHISELRDRLRRAREARKRAEADVTEATDLEHYIQAQLAAATSGRRHYLRPLLLLPGLVAGGVVAAKDAMAGIGGAVIAHKAAAGTLAAAAVIGAGTVVVDPSWPDDRQPPPHSAAGPATIARPAPSHAVHPQPRHTVETGQTRRAPARQSAEPAPTGQDASSDPADGHDTISDTAGTFTDTTSCVRIDLGQLGQVKLLCKGR